MMHTPNLSPQLVTALFCFCVGCCPPYCEPGGGESTASVTVPGDDGVFVQADAAAGGTSAKLVLERSTRRVGGAGEVTYVVPKSLTTQELRLELNDAGKGTTFLLAEHDAASAFEQHLVEVAEDGKRVAYRLGDQPWRFVYVLSNELAVHGPHEADALDWSKVPTLEEDFVDVFDAQSLRLDGLYRFEKKDPLLRWLRAHAGEQAGVDALFDLVPRDDHQWRSLVETLTEAGKASLAKKMHDAVVKGAKHPLYYSRALDIEAVEVDELPAASVRRAAQALADDEKTVANDGVDLAEYLRVYASHDAKGAAALGCKLIGTKSDGAPNGRPYALDLGRPLQLVAFATFANAGKACDAVNGHVDRRCDACVGPCSRTTLADAVKTTLETPLKAPEMGKTPSDEEMLAKLIAAAQVKANGEPESCR